jgi:hypothetical protein
MGDRMCDAEARRHIPAERTRLDSDREPLVQNGK